jgi:hypothetical protein
VITRDLSAPRSALSQDCIVANRLTAYGKVDTVRFASNCPALWATSLRKRQPPFTPPLATFLLGPSRLSPTGAYSEMIDRQFLNSGKMCRNSEEVTSKENKKI